MSRCVKIPVLYITKYSTIHPNTLLAMLVQHINLVFHSVTYMLYLNVIQTANNFLVPL